MTDNKNHIGQQVTSLVSKFSGTGQQISHDPENTIGQTHRPVHSEYKQHSTHQNTGDDDRSMLRHLCQNQHINRAAKQCDRQRAKECQYGKESKDSLTNHGAYHIQGSKDSSGNQIAYRQSFFHLLRIRHFQRPPNFYLLAELH